ncbi:hypothetical protein ABW19_dt0207376 [Dactylella cylindrospora]|nr:hypothetical protein ABW19_dt0207376 [Dactylella cylindrospora]
MLKGGSRSLAITAHERRALAAKIISQELGLEIPIHEMLFQPQATRRYGYEWVVKEWHPGSGISQEEYDAGVTSWRKSVGVSIKDREATMVLMKASLIVPISAEMKQRSRKNLTDARTTSGNTKAKGPRRRRGRRLWCKKSKPVLRSSQQRHISIRNRSHISNSQAPYSTSDAQNQEARNSVLESPGLSVDMDLDLESSCELPLTSEKTIGKRRGRPRLRKSLSLDTTDSNAEQSNSPPLVTVASSEGEALENNSDELELTDIEEILNTLPNQNMSLEHQNFHDQISRLVRSYAGFATESLQLRSDTEQVSDNCDRLAAEIEAIQALHANCDHEISKSQAKLKQLERDMNIFKDAFRWAKSTIDSRVGQH